MEIVRRAITRLAAKACYGYSRVPFARGYGRLGKWIASTAKPTDAPYLVRRCGAKWELHLDQSRWFADRGLMLYGRYEPETTAVIQRLVKPGMVCFDVGANMGFYTVLMARVAKSVVSFEPALSMHQRLRRHIELNHLSNVVAERLALSDHRGQGTIYVTPDTASIDPQHWSKDKAVSVDTFDCLTLDEYCSEHKVERIDFMKVDIDGHEAAFLRGAAETLSRHKPNLIIEIAPECLARGEQEATEICNWLVSLGYRLSDGFTTHFTSAEEAVAHQAGGGNLLCEA